MGSIIDDRYDTIRFDSIGGRRFASNCEKIICGHNTVCEQLRTKSVRKYTEVGAFDELPLGEEFQSHVRCFMRAEARTYEEKYRMAAKVIQQLAISARIAETKERFSRRNLDNEELDIRCLQILRAMIHNEERRCARVTRLYALYS